MATQARNDGITSGDGTTVRYRTFGGGGSRWCGSASEPIAVPAVILVTRRSAT